MISRITRFIITILLGLFIAGIIISFTFPISYKDYINKYSKIQGVDPLFISAIINVESKFNKNAISNKDARGLMQIGEQTGLWGAEQLIIEGYNEEMLFDPQTNIRIGTWYINRLKQEFGNNLPLVLAAYNAGSGNVSKWLQNKQYSEDGTSLNRIPFKETEEYLDKVFVNYKVYKLLYSDYMEKPDSMNSVYIDVIIYMRTLLNNMIKSFK
ncbi:lytic transglycosylase domain-containing protein [Tissierella creatinini]|nr:lytic transglycosylase domain-containing protein [Tissierella creatinini]TJX63633.1 lytic transglycosylase domain-containing protein [Soehngenia saccharolytica]